MNTVKSIGPETTNGAKNQFKINEPYRVKVRLKGIADILFHRWDCDGVEAKSKAAKNSKQKKTDDIATYVYRHPETGNLALPGEHLRMAIITMAKFMQDPRSPRKSACDLYKAAFIVETQFADFGVTNWDYEHRCRVTVQRNSVNRIRPALSAGWELEFDIFVILPEYVTPDNISQLIEMAGKLNGLGDFRPTYGRFRIVSFNIENLDKDS